MELPTSNIKGKDPAFLAGMTDAEYRKATGLSQSSLKTFLISPAHYLASTEEVREPTKAMNFGSAFHANMLASEPNDFYAVKKKVDGRSKEGKAYNDLFAVDNAGKIIIDEEEHSTIIAMADSIMAHPEALRLMSGLTHKEVAVFATADLGSGKEVRLKGLIDGYSETGRYIIDLKSCESASPEKVRRAIWDFRYDIQNCHYDWLLKTNNKPVDDFYFIFCEKLPPYAVGCYKISAESLIKSQNVWAFNIDYFSVCQSTGKYPAYSESSVTINL
jgi:exodeoxyribonuclease VIII